MIVTLTEAAELRGLRVWAKIADGTEGHWIFRSLTPLGVVVLAGEGGHERLVYPDELLSLKPEPVTCPDCKIAHQIDRASQRCADCEREAARKAPTAREVCSTCGADGAVYSPLAKAFRCPLCHAKAGTLTGISAEARAITEKAICRSDDIHSDRHSWRRTKSSFHCTQCKTKVFEKPKGYAG